MIDLLRIAKAEAKLARGELAREDVRQVPPFVDLLHPPWYWAPYIIALGAWDYWCDMSAVSHPQAFEHARGTLKRERHTVIRTAGMLVLLSGGVLLIARDVLAPWLASGAFHPSPEQLRWGSALLALAGVLLGASLIARTLTHALNRLYARGLVRLARRVAR